MANDNASHTTAAAARRGDQNQRQTGDDAGTQGGMGMHRRINHHVCTEDCNSPCSIGE